MTVPFISIGKIGRICRPHCRILQVIIKCDNHDNNRFWITQYGVPALAVKVALESGDIWGRGSVIMSPARRYDLHLRMNHGAAVVDVPTIGATSDIPGIS